MIFKDSIVSDLLYKDNTDKMTGSVHMGCYLHLSCRWKQLLLADWLGGGLANRLVGGIKVIV